MRHAFVISVDQIGGFGDLLFAIKSAQVIRDYCGYLGEVIVVVENNRIADALHELCPPEKTGVTIFLVKDYSQLLGRGEVVTDAMYFAPTLLSYPARVTSLGSASTPLFISREYNAKTLGSASVWKDFLRENIIDTGLFPSAELGGIYFDQSLVEAAKKKKQGVNAYRVDYWRNLQRDELGSALLGVMTPADYDAHYKLCLAYRSRIEFFPNFVRAHQAFIEAKNKQGQVSQHHDLVLINGEKKSEIAYKIVLNTVENLRRLGFSKLILCDEKNIATETVIDPHSKDEKIYRLIVRRRVPHEVMRDLQALSIDLIASTGDQSFGEAISANKIVIYEELSHKQELGGNYYLLLNKYTSLEKTKRFISLLKHKNSGNGGYPGKLLSEEERLKFVEAFSDREILEDYCAAQEKIVEFHDLAVQISREMKKFPQLFICRNKIDELSRAIIRNERDEIDALLSSGVNFLKENSYGQIPLHLAYIKRDVRTLMKMREIAGTMADLSLHDSLLLAIMVGDESVVRDLALKNPKLFFEKHERLPLLTWLAKSENAMSLKEEVQKLVDLSHSVSIREKYPLPLLRVALVLKSLVETEYHARNLSPTDFFWKDEYGKTVAMILADEASADVFNTYFTEVKNRTEFTDSLSQVDQNGNNFFHYFFRCYFLRLGEAPVSQEMLSEVRNLSIKIFHNTDCNPFFALNDEGRCPLHFLLDNYLFEIRGYVFDVIFSLFDTESGRSVLLQKDNLGFSVWDKLKIIVDSDFIFRVFCELLNKNFKELDKFFSVEQIIFALKEIGQKERKSLKRDELFNRLYSNMPSPLILIFFRKLLEIMTHETLDDVYNSLKDLLISYAAYSYQGNLFPVFENLPDEAIRAYQDFFCNRKHAYWDDFDLLFFDGKDGERIFTAKDDSGNNFIQQLINVNNEDRAVILINFIFYSVKDLKLLHRLLNERNNLGESVLDMVKASSCDRLLAVVMSLPTHVTESQFLIDDPLELVDKASSSLATESLRGADKSVPLAPLVAEMGVFTLKPSASRPSSDKGDVVEPIEERSQKRVKGPQK